MFFSALDGFISAFTTTDYSSDEDSDDEVPDTLTQRLRTTKVNVLPLLSDVSERQLELSFIVHDTAVQALHGSKAVKAHYDDLKHRTLMRGANGDFNSSLNLGLQPRIDLAIFHAVTDFALYMRKGRDDEPLCLALTEIAVKALSLLMPNYRTLLVNAALGRKAPAAVKLVEQVRSTFRQLSETRRLNWNDGFLAQFIRWLETLFGITGFLEPRQEASGVFKLLDILIRKQMASFKLHASQSEQNSEAKTDFRLHLEVCEVCWDNDITVRGNPRENSLYVVLNKETLWPQLQRYAPTTRLKKRICVQLLKLSGQVSIDDFIQANIAEFNEVAGSEKADFVFADVLVRGLVGSLRNECKEKLKLHPRRLLPEVHEVVLCSHQCSVTPAVILLAELRLLKRSNGRAIRGIDTHHPKSRASSITLQSETIWSLEQIIYANGTIRIYAPCRGSLRSIREWWFPLAEDVGATENDQTIARDLKCFLKASFCGNLLSSSNYDKCVDLIDLLFQNLCYNPGSLVIFCMALDLVDAGKTSWNKLLGERGELPMTSTHSASSSRWINHSFRTVFPYSYGRFKFEAPLAFDAISVLIRKEAEIVEKWLQLNHISETDPAELSQIVSTAVSDMVGVDFAHSAAVSATQNTSGYRSKSVA